MNFTLRFPTVLSVVALSTAHLVLVLPALAQEANVLGLPAIPQPKPGSAPAAGSPAASASSAANKAGPATAPTPNTRNALAGELGVQHSSRDGVGRIIFTTRTAFQTGSARSDAIEAARSVQKDLVKSCLKQCQPVPMAAPKLLASGQLEFELAFKPLHQTLAQAQFVAALQSQPLNLTAAQLAAPVVAPPQVNVQVAPAPAPVAPAASASPPPAPASVPAAASPSK
jgi:hypothetical protein